MIRTVVLVSNDPALYKKVKESLEDISIRLLPMVSNIKSIADSYKQDFFSLAMVDYFLAETTGLEAVKFIAKINGEMPIVFLHRLKSRHAIEGAFKVGASDCLSIPFENRLLQSTVSHRLDRIKEVGTVYFEKVT